MDLWDLNSFQELTGWLFRLIVRVIDDIMIVRSPNLFLGVRGGSIAAFPLCLCQLSPLPNSLYFSYMILLYFVLWVLCESSMSPFFGMKYFTGYTLCSIIKLAEKQFIPVRLQEEKKNHWGSRVY